MSPDHSFFSTIVALSIAFSLLLEDIVGTGVIKTLIYSIKRKEKKKEISG